MYTRDNIINRLQEHLKYALSVYNMDWFVICLQGSFNYGMADDESDIDSKLMVIPSLKDIVLNNKSISHTLEMPDNKEHVDVKDVRDYFKIFRKSNINFVEVLFTDYYIVNPKYEDIWQALLNKNEELARINPYAAVSCMKGMASEKVHALCHEYPSRMTWINKYGYDPKQLSHLLRIEYFIKHYIAGSLYKDCIYPKEEDFRNYLLKVKRTGNDLTKEEAIIAANNCFNEIKSIADNFRLTCDNENDEELDEFLNEQMYRLISRSIKEQLYD